MFFALGVLVAGLLGLMVLPALWRRAERLSTRRLEMQVPLSMEEVLADRDLLRAEFAVAERRREEQMAQLAEAHTRSRSELGRKTAALSLQGESLSGLTDELRRIEAALSYAQAESVDLRAQLGAALVEVHDGIVARERLAASVEEAQALARRLNERQVTVAGLEARLATFEMRAHDLQRDLTERDKVMISRQTVIERLTEERDRARHEITQYAEKQASLRNALEARDRQVSELDDARADLMRKLAMLERQLREKNRYPALESYGAEAGGDDAQLRRSIADLGADVLRITRALEAGATQAPPAATETPPAALEEPQDAAEEPEKKRAAFN